MAHTANGNGKGAGKGKQKGKQKGKSKGKERANYSKMRVVSAVSLVTGEMNVHNVFKRYMQVMLLLGLLLVAVSQL